MKPKAAATDALQARGHLQTITNLHLHSIVDLLPHNHNVHAKFLRNGRVALAPVPQEAETTVFQPVDVDGVVQMPVRI